MTVPDHRACAILETAAFWCHHSRSTPHQDVGHRPKFYGTKPLQHRAAHPAVADVDQPDKSAARNLVARIIAPRHRKNAVQGWIIKPKRRGSINQLHQAHAETPSGIAYTIGTRSHEIKYGSMTPKFTPLASTPVEIEIIFAFTKTN